MSDYRLNERHYGALQGYVKAEVEQGLYGHDYASVQAWRRSWYAVPPLLDDDDPRRIHEVKVYRHHCGGDNESGGINVPRGESLEMVANNRIRPFLDTVLHPVLNEAAESKREKATRAGILMSREGKDVGGCGLVVAHANSLRALIGVLCGVEKDPVALKQLEAMKIQTGVPLIMKYRQLHDGTYEACPFMDMQANNDIFTTHESVSPRNNRGNRMMSISKGGSLPVLPLSCLPRNSLDSGVLSDLYDYVSHGEQGRRKSSRTIRIDVI